METALLVDKIIEKLSVNNIIVMGKCAGGGIAIKLITLNNKYTGLYLAVPASPFCLQFLTCIQKKLPTMIFRFAWTKDDPFIFPWSIYSKDEKTRYDDLAQQLGLIDYKSNMFEAGGHEIPNMFFKFFSN